MFKSKDDYYDELRWCVEDAIAEKKVVEDYAAANAVHDQGLIAFGKAVKDFYFMTYPLCYALVIMKMERLPSMQLRECEQNQINGNSTPTVSAFRLRRSEIYDALMLFRPKMQECLIRSVSASARIQDDLLDALGEANKEAFISILKSPECDYSRLASTLYEERALFYQWQLLSICHSFLTGEEVNTDNLNQIFEATLEEPKYGASVHEIIADCEGIDGEDLIINCFEKFQYFILSVIVCEYKKFKPYPSEASILKPILGSEEYLSFCDNYKNEIDSYYCYLEDTQNTEDVSNSITASLVDEQDRMVSTTETPLLQESSQLDGGVKKKDVVPTASISAEETEKPRNKGGRKRAIWYKGDYSEEEVQSKLEAVWKGIELYMDELVYYHHSGGNLIEVKQGRAKEQAKKALGAALILSATNEAGLAKESNSTCTESIGRSFDSLAGRNSIQPYFEVVNSILVKAMNQGKTTISSGFIDKHSIDCKNATPLHKEVLKTNYLNLYILYNNSVCLICEQFKLKTSRKFIDWPEPEDKVLSRSKEYKEGYGVDSSDSSDD